jgi:thymidine kinase
MIGGQESYEARCRRCHTVPRVDEDQLMLVNTLNAVNSVNGEQ